MSVNRDTVTNELLFETLKAIQVTLGRHGEELREIKGRIGIVEVQIGTLTVQYASLSNRIDRIEDRLDRIERRLDLAPA